MTLLSTLLTLTPAEPTTLPANLGRATHAWFLDRITAHDRGLAERLHAPNQERPFTVSNLIGGRRSEIRGRSATVRLQPDRHYTLRLTSYDPELTALLEERLLPSLPETVSLAGCSLAVGGVITGLEQPGAERPPDDRSLQSWAGRTSFESLVAEHTLQADIPAGVALRFASPTLFKSKGVFMPIPLPRLVFEGLVRRWNAFSPIQVHPDVSRYAEECLVVSSYHLRTETVRFGTQAERGAFPGCVGVCRYAMTNKDHYWMGLVRLLAAFSLYAGVGKQTTMGLGQCRLLD